MCGVCGLNGAAQAISTHKSMFLSRNYHKITTNLRVFLYHYALAHFGVDRCFLWLGQSSVKVTQKAGLMTPRKIRRFDSPNKPPLRSTEVLHKALESMRAQSVRSTEFEWSTPHFKEDVDPSRLKMIG